MVLSTVINSGLGMLFWVAAARLYSVTDVGLAAAAVSAAALLMGFGQLGLPAALPRLIPAAGTSARWLVAACYRAAILASLIAAAVFALVAFRLPNVRELFIGVPLFLLWFVLSVPFSSIFSIQDFVLCGLKRAGWTPLENLAASLGRLALLVPLTALGAHGLYIATTVPVVALSILYTVLIFGRLVPRQAATGRVRDVAELRRLITADFVGNVATTFAIRALPLIVVAAEGSASAAVFYAGWTVIYAIEVVASNILTTATVSGAEDPTRLRDGIRGLFRPVAVAVVVVIAALWLLARPVLQLFSDEYAAGTGALQLLALALAPRLVTMAGAAAARLQKRSSPIVALQVLGAIVTVVGAAVGVRIAGINGVAAAYALAATVTAAAAAPVIASWLRSPSPIRAGAQA